MDNQIIPIQNVQPSQESNILMSILTFIKIILILGILFFILYEINKQTDNSITNFIKNLFHNSKQSTQTTQSTQNDGTSNQLNDWITYFNTKKNTVLPMIKTSLSSSTIQDSLPEKSNKIKNKVNNLNTFSSPSPQPDNASSSIQNKGFCYMGEWNGSKLCMNNYDICYTGKIYDTKDECIKTS